MRSWVCPFMAEADPNFTPRKGRLVRQVPDSVIATPLAILTALLGLVVLAWLVLYITKGRFLRHPFERTVSSMLARDVRVAGDFQLYFDPIDTKFVAEGLTISNPAWRGGQFFKSKRIDTRIATLPLIFGTRRVKWLDLTNGTLDLAWDKAHKRNTFTFGNQGKPFELPDIRAANIVGTKISYIDPSLLLKTNIRVETIRAKDTRFAGDIRFTGDGTMRAIPFTLSGSLLSPNAALAGGKNKLAMAIRSGRTALDVSGTLPSATVIEGADLKLLARGPNLSLLFDFLGVAIPDTRTYRVTSDLTKAGVDWKFTRLAGRFGDSDLGGSMTVSVPPAGRMNIAADLRTRTLDIIDAGPFMGYEPARLEAGKVAVPVAGVPRILPDAPLRIEAIKRFDAQVKYHVQNIRAKNVPISNVALALDLNDSILKLSPLTFDVAGGHLWSDISINARDAPVKTAYDIRLSPTPMGKLLARFGTDQSGTTGTVKARIQMTGVGDSVRTSLASANGRIAVIIPHGTFWTRNIQLAELDLGTYVQKLVMNKLKNPVEINCGLIAFTVRNGVAGADPILIDTTKNVIAGRGGFSFRDESLDLAFRGDGKKFSLFSAQSPIGVNGHFAAPGIKIISDQLLGRAGVGLGLSLVATPLAGLLAFVDVGDAKSAQCGPILTGAPATAQRTTKGQPRDDVAPKGATPHKKKFLGIF
ncbi:AsmA family protein [Sphingomonas sp.]|uniref:AsmA family protein n=1 Tax=Sphingomonas sp. TaxID=28214 RepID=UPI0025D6A59D|nr:AsmA family protein [Sphingomonas sp.]